MNSIVDPQHTLKYWAGSPYLECLNTLKEALTCHESVITLTGLANVGKTALCQELRDSLIINQDCVFYFANPPTSNQQFQLECRAQQPQLQQMAFTAALEKRLIEVKDKGCQSVLIIDNAHLLNIEMITTIRIMSNLQTHTQRLLQVVLSGKPQLLKVLSQPQSSGFAQRVTDHLALLPMNKQQLDLLVSQGYSTQLKGETLNLMYALCKGRPGIAIKMAQLLAQQTCNDPMSNKQFIDAMKLNPEFYQLYLRHQLSKALLPGSVILILLGLFLYHQVTSLPTPVAISNQQQALGVTPNISPNSVVVQAEQSQPKVLPPNLAKALQYWVDAWQGQDMDNYFSVYVALFSPNAHTSNRQWRKERMLRIIRPLWIKLSAESIEVISKTEKRISVKVWLSYAAEGYQDKTLKQIDWVNDNGRWLIESEQNLKLTFD